MLHSEITNEVLPDRARIFNLCSFDLGNNSNDDDDDDDMIIIIIIIISM